MKKKTLKTLFCLMAALMVMTMFSMPAFAAGDVAGAIKSTWSQAQTQIKDVVNNVVFPVIDMVLAISIRQLAGPHGLSEGGSL